MGATLEERFTVQAPPADDWVSGDIDEEDIFIGLENALNAVPALILWRYTPALEWHPPWAQSTGTRGCAGPMNVRCNLKNSLKAVFCSFKSFLVT